MDLVSLITAVALLLIAIGISSKGTGALTTLAGMGLFAVAVVARLWTGSGVVAVLVPLFRDAGIALLVAAVWLGLRKLGTNARPFLILGLGALIVAGLLYGASRLWNTLWNIAETSILVELGPDDDIAEIAPLLQRYDAGWEEAFPTVTLAENEDLAQVFVVEAPSHRVGDLMDALRADVENIDHVELNVEIALPLIPEGSARSVEGVNVLENDPHVHAQWALHAIDGHEAHALLQNVTPVRKARIAILDTGIEAEHEDLAPVYLSGSTSDLHGHGTHCAGIAGAATNNGLGIASLNWEGRFIELMGFEALGNEGRGTLEQIAQAIVDATKAEVDVISMSLGSVAEVPPRVLVTAISYAQDRGIIVAASAGNSNEDAINHYPSNIDGVIAVAAVDQELSKAKFSNTVGRLARPIAAPGVDILSSHLSGSYRSLSGTSMATPVVTGLLGTMRAVHPALTASEAYAILHETGTEVEDTPAVGRLVNAAAALKALLP